MRVIFLFVVLFACRPAPSLPQAAVPTPTSLSDAEIAFFDRWVTPERLVPHPRERALYRWVLPETRDGQRHYALELMPQPGMNKKRHFHVISVTVARSGQLLPASVRTPKQTSTTGPGGSFFDLTVRTDDGAYDLRVGQSMLLVEGTSVPSFDNHAIIDALSQFDAAAANSRISP